MTHATMMDILAELVGLTKAEEVVAQAEQAEQEEAEDIFLTAPEEEDIFAGYYE